MQAMNLKQVMEGTLLMAAMLAGGPAAWGQRVIRDEPTAYMPMEEPQSDEEPKSGFMRFVEGVCWYLPNRLADLSDVPRFYITAGEGMEGSVRATKYLNASWAQVSAFGLGWSGERTAPFFGEDVEEAYLGFLAAQEGERDRDPTEVGLSFHFIMFGANAALSLSEGADFLAGLVGIDLRGDDHGPFIQSRIEEDEQARYMNQFSSYIPDDETDPGPAARLPRVPAEEGTAAEQE